MPEQNPKRVAICDDDGDVADVVPVSGGRFASLTNAAPSPVVGGPTTVSTSGDTALYTPAAGRSARVRWVGLRAASTNGAPVTVVLSLGGTVIYRWELEPSDIFSHGFNREGPVNGALSVNLSASQTVYCNVDAEDF